MDLIHTKPKNEIEAAIIARSRELTDFKWTPVRDIPTRVSRYGDFSYIVLPEGEPLRGFLYSSTEETDKFFTENVTHESFLSAIPNPYSKLYQPGHGAFAAANYGIVCNGLVRYAYGIPYRVPTKMWYSIPGMCKVMSRGEYTVDELRLCDILYAFGEGHGHVALITDIIKNENGEVVGIEVSEAVRPTCRRATFTPEEYYEKYKRFEICRYDRMDEVPPLDRELHALLFESGIEKITPRIAVDNGNKSNYLLGEETIITANTDGTDKIEILSGSKVIEEYTVTGKAVIPVVLPRGYYIARLKKSGDYTEFAVCKAEVTHEVKDGKITVSADPCDENSEIWYMDFRGERRSYGNVSHLVKHEILTTDEKECGVFTREIPEGAYNFKVYYKNEYGVWTHPMTPVI